MAEHAHSTPGRRTPSAPGAGRRRLFGAAALLLAPISAAAVQGISVTKIPSADRYLIEACERCSRLQADFDIARQAMSESEARGDYAQLVTALRSSQAPLVNVICANPPSTPAGAQSLALLLIEYLGIEDYLHIDDLRDDPDERMQFALLSGLATWGAA